MGFNTKLWTLDSTAGWATCCGLCRLCSRLQLHDVRDIADGHRRLGRGNNELKDVGRQLIPEQSKLTQRTRTVAVVRARVQTIPLRLHHQTQQRHYLLVVGVMQTGVRQHALNFNLPMTTTQDANVNVNCGTIQRRITQHLHCAECV